MSLYKFNTFHWHLTDDQGWRIEIKQFPKLTEIGAWRDSTVENHYTTKPRTYKKELYGGFYTQDQIREVVAYAASKYMDTYRDWETITGDSSFMESSCRLQSELREGFWDWLLIAKWQPFVRSIVVRVDRKSTRLNSSHSAKSRMPSSA